MLPQAPTCRRALQRQVTISSDSQWVSDEALSHAYQRFFVVSKTRKRYGSFIPGPLESRRRMGKRRMTLQSEAPQTPATGLGTLWAGLFGGAGQMDWQWQAPNPQGVKAEGAVSALAKCFRGWRNTAKVAMANPTVPSDSTAAAVRMRAWTFKADCLTFRRALKECTAQNRSTICYDFNQKLKQTLLLGLDSEKTASYVLSHIPGDIREAFSESEDQANRHCLELCQAIWEGISVCKVMQPTDFDACIISRMMRTLSELSMCQGVQTLADQIWSAVSVHQLERMKPSIALLIDSWAESWSRLAVPDSCKHLLALAEEAVLIAKRHVLDIQTFLLTTGNTSLFEADLEAARKALEQAKPAIDRAADAIIRADDFLIPQRQSTRALANALNNLPRWIRKAVIISYSARIANANTASDAPFSTIRNCWLSVVAKVAHVDARPMLATSWKAFEETNAVAEDIASDVIFDLWVNQGLIKRPSLTRVFFEIAAAEKNRRDYSILLFALDAARQNSWSRTMSLFKFINNLSQEKLGRDSSAQHTVISDTIGRMRELQMLLPHWVFDTTLEMMATKQNFSLVRKTLRNFQRMRINEVPLRVHICPNFIFSRIEDRCERFRTTYFWEKIGIPLYESMPASSRAKHAFVDPRTTPPLTPATIGIITKMAMLFAFNEGLSPRTALRNVMQCVFHLQRHHVPITPELTRAIMHAGVTRTMLNKSWIPKERVTWMLSLIEKGEGTEVAMNIDDVITVWNQHVSEEFSMQDRMLARERNVLRK
ncbi:hypothetical protein LZ554_002308 [Drepanopeziza brunnea f. sp. 'monogermtubi']|nr:hypothetical protein LZ554_002308 [Drepanopeziza brunnea f. sp. 'monogermtubi']